MLCGVLVQGKELPATTRHLVMVSTVPVVYPHLKGGAGIVKALGAVGSCFSGLGRCARRTAPRHASVGPCHAALLAPVVGGRRHPASFCCGSLHVM